jgi:hypothetical protein
MSNVTMGISLREGESKAYDVNFLLFSHCLMVPT